MSVPEIDVEELARLREKGVVVVDVRQPDEYERAHVPGARLIPLVDVPERIEEIPDTETVYVICGSGPRSEKAVEYLNRQGYDTVNVVGGTSDSVVSTMPRPKAPFTRSQNRWRKTWSNVAFVLTVLRLVLFGRRLIRQTRRRKTFLSLALTHR